MGSHVFPVLAILALSLGLIASCNVTEMRSYMDIVCLTDFVDSVHNLSVSERCNWSLIHSHYERLSLCTEHIAGYLHCFWPNHEVDNFFVEVHRKELSGCPAEMSSLRDPPEQVLAIFISVPMVLTTVAAGLVVWCSKRSEGGD